MRVIVVAGVAPVAVVAAVLAGWSLGAVGALVAGFYVIVFVLALRRRRLDRIRDQRLREAYDRLGQR